jgi:two-component sensor histidine kinase
MVDRDMRYVKAEGPSLAAFVEGTGVTELVGRTVYEVVQKKNVEHILALYQSGFAGESKHIESRRGDRFFDVDTVPVLDGGSASHVLIVLHDVTRRKQELAQLQAMLQEIHHRVKNNLQVISSLINMQVRKLDDGASRDALVECQTRVQAIALIHEKLYQSNDYARVSFSDYARSLAANIFHATGVSPSAVSLELAIDDVALPVHKAIPCGLVLNELITNALKHAFGEGRAGTVRVGLAKADDTRAYLSVDDDGVGLPEGLDVRRTNSLGLQLVAALAQQLDGDLTIGNAEGNQTGASFRLTFPVD